MGYTHYWYRKKSLDAQKFLAFSKDVERILRYCQDSLGIALGDAFGDGVPTVNGNLVAFNGSVKQPIGKWTTHERVSIPWPAPQADLSDEINDPTASKVGGEWYAGDLLLQRVAPVSDGYGDGSYESFVVQREWDEDFPQPDSKGRMFGFCKTAYRPYDLAVTAALIALKHHFGDDVRVTSDGDMPNWRDGQFLCMRLFGYGESFTLEQ